MGDKIPIGAAMNKGLTFKMGQTHVQAYTKPLLEKIEAGEIDPSFVVTHPASLEDAPDDVQEVPRQGRRRHQGDAAAGRLSVLRQVRAQAHGTKIPAWSGIASSNWSDRLNAASILRQNGGRVCVIPRAGLTASSCQDLRA